MLDLVPLARARRKVAHRDGEPGVIRQPLQFPFPEPEAGAVTPTRIPGDQQRLRGTVHWPSHDTPPATDCLDPETRPVVIHAHAPPPFIAPPVLSAVPNSLPPLRPRV